MQRIVSGRDVDLAVDVRIGGEPGTVVLIHATGFCKETWLPVVAALRGRVATVALDQRGHGRSGKSDPPFDWWDLAADALHVLDVMDPPPPHIGLGHSSGGAALAMAEIVTPGTFDSLVLVEPIVFPGPYGRTEDHPLTVGALRRRRAFDSIDDVLATFRGRGPFARWVDEALLAYAEFGTVEDEGGGRRLACPPEVEAEFYRAATAHGAWDRLGEIRCPVTVVVGEDSDSHPREVAAALTGRFRDADLVVVPGATHFVPMECPEALARVVSALIAHSS
jgi:pimeloyl-ACP methyl ester carboxylesterase